MSEEQQPPLKKMLVMDTGLYDDPEFINVQGDDEKSILDLIEEMAENWESKGYLLEANRIRGTLETHRLFYKGQPISPETLLRDLVFDIVVEDNDTCYRAEINFQQDQSGGRKPKHGK